MSKKASNMRVLIAIIIIVFAAFFHFFKQAQHANVSVIPQKTYSESMPDAEEKTTAIPGFDCITLKAGKESQRVELYNPPQNECYFLISILLPDGTEIYKSEMLAPGQAISSISLNKALKAGIYEESSLIYSCYSIEDLSTMNGASIMFTLEVKP